MRELSLKELQDREYLILKEFASYCRTKKLKFILAYGTLIGAIRHNGFIPWDDDIDILMPREDYEYFVQSYNKDNDGNFEVVSFKVFDSSVTLAAVLTDKRTYFKGEWDDSSCKEFDRIRIEIAPFDLVPDGALEKNLFLAKLNVLHKINMIKSIKKRKRGLLKNLILFTVQLILYPISQRWLVREIDSLAQKYRGTNARNGSALLIGQVLYNIMERNEMEGYDNVLFVDDLYPIPKGYDKWLKDQYGDYMTPPSEGQRIGHQNLYKAAVIVKD